MIQAPAFLSRLTRAARGEETDASVVAGADTVQTPVEPAPEPEVDPGIVNALASKVLLAWLRNRYQLLFPFSFDLRRLDRTQAELAIHAMVAAAQADGSFDGKERERIEGAMSLMNPSEAEHGVLAAALDNPRPLNDLLRDVRDVQTGALIYAASLLAVDQRKPVNRHYLRYLAARLQLSDELLKSLEQRFGSGS